MRFFSFPKFAGNSVNSTAMSGKQLLLLLIACLLFPTSTAFAQAPSSILPDLSKFKLTFPLDANGNDYEGVSYSNRNSPLIKAYERDNLVNWTAPNTSGNNLRQYFYSSGNEVVFKCHVAGALTSANSYPRTELRETPNGGDNYWNFNDAQELNATFRIMHLPNVKQEVCVLQIKGREGTESADEALRLDYREGSSQRLHLVWNENNTINDIMDYSLGQTIEARIFVDNKRVYVTLNNTSVSGSRGQYTYDYAVPYNTGYFKAGCYTQSSIWKEKNGTGQNESPSAYAEVRFSRLILGSDNSTSCIPSVPSNRRVRSISSNSAILDWNAVANIDHYKCRYRKVGTSSWTTSGSIRGTSQWNISGLSSNTQYQWQVRSKCGGGNDSNYTNGPNFTTSGSGGGGNPVVTMRKRNATGYAIDGNGGGANNQNVHLWSYNVNNANQRWIEIPRGNDFYSYQKEGTNYCLDGGNGGARGQNLKLWSCSSTNQNQQWKKVSVGGGAHRLYKRNATAYNINGGSGGANGRNVNIYDNTSSWNVHWIFTTVGSSNRPAAPEEVNVDLANDLVGGANVDAGTDDGHLSFWPNPSQDALTVLVPATGSTKVTQIAISDLLGRTVYQRTDLQAGDQFDISQPLPKGTYILRWIGEDGELLQSDKIIRQ